MSDVNVIITAVDKGMDIIDGYEREVEDLRAHVVFDIHSVIEAVEREKSFVEQEMDDLCYSSYEDTEDDSGDKADMLSRQRPGHHREKLPLYRMWMGIILWLSMILFLRENVL